MVLKKVNSKTSTSKHKAPKAFSTIAVATVRYGPYPTKQVAEAFLSKVLQVPRCKVTPITKTAKGFTFKASVFYGLKTASQKATAVATIKKHAPSATITFRKA